MSYSIRPAVASDAPTLWQMLYYAAQMADDGATSPEPAKTNAFLAPFVEDWGQPGDLGSVAVDDASGEAIGAAWLRVLGGVHADDEVHAGLPELAIAVAPAYIGQGVGTCIMKHLLDATRDIYPAVMLRVRDTNPARRLYERLGFVVVDETINRVGGTSYLMRLDLA